MFDSFDDTYADNTAEAYLAVVGRAARRIAAAVRGRRGVVVLLIRTAANNAPIPFAGTWRKRSVVRAIPTRRAGRPLPSVADHVEDAEGGLARLITVHGDEAARRAVGVSQSRTPVVSPRVKSPVRAARSELPLRFSGQTVGHAVTLRAPLRVGARGIPCDAGHGLSFRTFRVGAVSPILRQRALLLGDTLFVILARDLVDVYEERRDRHFVRG